MRIQWIYESCRIFLGLLFLSSGVSKFYGESGMMGPGYIFESLEAYQLKPFAIFIAVIELIIGFLLLIRRFATLGSLMLFSVLISILVIVISLSWQGTPWLVSVFLIMNFYLLFYDLKKLLPILGISSMEEVRAVFTQTRIYLLALLLILCGVFGSYFWYEKLYLLNRVGYGLILINAFYRHYLYVRNSKNTISPAINNEK